MISDEENVVVMLTVGKSDNGKNATLAFSCALSSLAMGHKTTVFLTSDGAIWGFEGSTKGIRCQGFPPLSELVEQYQAGGGRIILCSVCHRTCSPGDPDVDPVYKQLQGTEIGGFATIIELARGGTTICF